MAREEDLDTLRRYYAAWNEGGIEAALTYWAEGFEWHDAPQMPDAGVFRGEDAVIEHFRDLGATLGDMKVAVGEMTTRGNEVMVALNVQLDATLGGLEIDGLIYETVLVEGGKLSRIRLFLKREDALEALGG
jgi:ketosteroid isomerase-like protein